MTPTHDEIVARFEAIDREAKELEQDLRTSDEVFYAGDRVHVAEVDIDRAADENTDAARARAMHAVDAYTSALAMWRAMRETGAMRAYRASDITN